MVSVGFGPGSKEVVGKVDGSRDGGELSDIVIADLKLFFLEMSRS